MPADRADQAAARGLILKIHVNFSHDDCNIAHCTWNAKQWIKLRHIDYGIDAIIKTFRPILAIILP